MSALYAAGAIAFGAAAWWLSSARESFGSRLFVAALMGFGWPIAAAFVAWCAVQGRRRA